jgi:hypothetical protein
VASGVSPFYTLAFGIIGTVESMLGENSLGRTPVLQGSEKARLRYVLAWFFALFCAALVLARDSWAPSGEPKPPQLSVDFFYPPSPLIQHGRPRLVYEMRISNYVPLSYVLDSIDVRAGSKTFTFSGATLQDMMRFFGEKARVAATRRFEPGRSAVIYFLLEFKKPEDIPEALRHILHFTSPDGGHHALAPEPLHVMQREPIVVDAPLHGKDWIAADSVHNTPDAAHRRTILLLDASPGWLSGTRSTGCDIALSTEPERPGPVLKTVTPAISATTRQSITSQMVLSWKRQTGWRKIRRTQEGTQWLSISSTPAAIMLSWILAAAAMRSTRICVLGRSR